MLSDLITYALLGSVFILTGLRMFFEKPNKLTEIRLVHGKKLLRSKDRH